MDKFKDKLLLIGSIVSVLIGILNLVNNVSKSIDFFYIHWVATPIIIFFISAIFVYFLFKYYLTNNNNIIITNGTNNYKNRKLTRIRNIILAILLLFTITSIVYNYCVIYNCCENPKLRSEIYQ